MIKEEEKKGMWLRGFDVERIQDLRFKIQDLRFKIGSCAGTVISQEKDVSMRLEPGSVNLSW